eukprot:CAMPEP_0177771448 /NCGR_PEP_ID=MMETSP0491_2-20121128/11597_1 /TAXON_ID=63592 /ORGANISM="Tetraselmis chuii, Strain PLY429" /LENGTH=372 /DNA_ID=CAMNT_0019288997 /DNA_START=84 /DNA_END=1202 /DNA_ORIENTATION=-
MAVTVSASATAPRTFVGGRAAAPTRRFGASTQGLVTAARPSYVRASRRGQVIECKKVAVLGAAGGIGQPLALLLKMNKLVTELSLYDIQGTPGVAADLSHCNTPVKVKGYMGDDELEAALTGCELVVIPAGVPRKPGMTRDDLFSINAGIVKNLAGACAKYCPNAVLNIISNPVNSTVPITSEVYKAAGQYDPKKIIGVTTLDVVRSNTFVSELKGLPLKDVDVPVVGGHAGVTILPLLSQTFPKVTFTQEEIEALTPRIQEAGTEVVEAKAGKGSATLSMAYAAARMAESCLLALSGEEKVVECGYVASDIVPGCDYFASKLLLGPDGVQEIYPLGTLTDYEKTKLEEVIPMLQGNIKKGIEFATKEATTA